MKKLVLAFGILAGVVSVGMGAMSGEEWITTHKNCLNKDKNACQALINNGLPSVEQCNKDDCGFVGAVYRAAGRYREAIPYFEKAIALGDDRVRVYGGLANVYLDLQDYYNAKKYFEMGCNKGNGNVYHAASCAILGGLYVFGQGVRQDYAKAAELFKKACDMKNAPACENLGMLYGEGLGVKQNLSTAKQYFGKACDLGYQRGCVNYKQYNEQGVR